MGVCIFFIGGIVAAHHKTTKVVPFNYTKNVTISTIPPGPIGARGGGSGGGGASEFNYTLYQDGGGAILTSIGLDHAFTAFPFSPGPSYSQEPGRPAMSRNRTDLVYTPPASGGRGQTAGDSSPVLTKTEKRPAVESALVHTKCMVDTGTIHEMFFKYFHKMYISIFILSCIIVLALYSFIYRWVGSVLTFKLKRKYTE